MAFSVIPYALQNVAHSADLFRQATSSLALPGGGIVTLGDFAVTQTGTPSMNVSVGVGRIWIPGTNVGNVTGGNFSTQAMYFGQNDAAQTVSVTTSDPINPRIDVVYAAVEDSQYAGATNTGKLAIVAGVPTSGATYPTNAPALPNNATALAYITVPAGASSIVNANITKLTGFPCSPASFAKGGQHHSQIATNSGNVTALTVIYNIASFDFKAGRRYRITWDFQYQGTTAGNYITALIGTCLTTDAAGATTGVTQRNGRKWKIHDGSIDSSGRVTAIYVPGAADLTRQVKFLIQVTTGAGTARISGSSLEPVDYIIEDIGAQH